MSANKANSYGPTIALVNTGSYDDLAAKGMAALYVELWDDAEARKKRKAKAASKTKYTCPDCGSNAWAKPKIRLICGECEVLMLADEAEEEDEGEEDLNGTNIPI